MERVQKQRYSLGHKAFCQQAAEEGGYGTMGDIWA
jgi:hypothetical protein